MEEQEHSLEESGRCYTLANELITNNLVRHALQSLSQILISVLYSEFLSKNGGNVLRLKFAQDIPPVC